MVPALPLVLMLASLENGGALAGLVITRPRLTAGVGGSVLLECFFQSLVPGAWNVTKVDWIHRPENPTGREEMVFYYYSNYSVPVGRFQHRVQWCGDVARSDGSVRLQDVQADDSGTYTCEIRVFGQSSVFKNYTVLHVAYVRQISLSPQGSGFAGAQDPETTSSNGWGPILGYLCAAAFLPLVLGLGLRTILRKQRAAESGTRPSSPDAAEEGVYSLIPCAEVLKAGQEAEWKSKADTTYLTMRPCAAFQLEHNVYVQLGRKTIPVEWMDEGRLGTEGAPESKQARGKSICPEEEFPYVLCGVTEPSLA
ncbi:junctional adhesion molecule-like isoform X3 [Pelodiscus sinensis]